MSLAIAPASPGGELPWPLDLTRYDRCPALTGAERATVNTVAATYDGANTPQWVADSRNTLRRLVQPLEDVLARSEYDDDHAHAMRVVVTEMARRGTAFWAWSEADWREIVAPDMATFRGRYALNAWGNRQQLLALAYLLGGLPFDPAWCAGAKRLNLARRIFGAAAVDAAVTPVLQILERQGYRRADTQLRGAVCLILLDNRSPRLADVTFEGLQALRARTRSRTLAGCIGAASQALVDLGLLPRALPRGKQPTPLRERVDTTGVPPDWLERCLAWHDLAPVEPQTKRATFTQLLIAGRWLAATHPALAGPADWTTLVAAEYVAAVGAMQVGDWVDPGRCGARVGRPLQAKTQNARLSALRLFFRDLQEWGLIPRRLSPERAFATPLAVRRKIGPDPRVIDPVLWAKLLWAALHLAREDLPTKGTGGLPYPLELVRAVAIVWCFAGLRTDEITRLRVGCIRWQRQVDTPAEEGATPPAEAICFLDVPVSKTQSAFTKAVHPLVGQRIGDWERVRPAQRRIIDRKTGQLMDPLFAIRGHGLSREYINKTLIPVLCRKADVPAVGGDVQAHRRCRVWR